MDHGLDGRVITEFEGASVSNRLSIIGNSLYSVQRAFSGDAVKRHLVGQGIGIWLPCFLDLESIQIPNNRLGIEARVCGSLYETKI